MSDWKTIKDEAEAVKKVCQGVGDIQKNFDPLLKKYNDDPMVRYIRGETYEFFDDIYNACKDYEYAKEKFPCDTWEEKAVNKFLKLGCTTVSVKASSSTAEK